jgi:predicted transcriptional regulator
MRDERKPGVLEGLLLRDKPARILISLKTSKESIYATILSRETNCTYSHTIKILNTLQKMGIVKFDKKGRIKKVVLTSDGWDIAHNLEALTKKFEQVEEKAKESEKAPKKEKSEKKKKK